MLTQQWWCRFKVRELSYTCYCLIPFIIYSMYNTKTLFYKLLLKFISFLIKIIIIKDRTMSNIFFVFISFFDPSVLLSNYIFSGICGFSSSLSVNPFILMKVTPHLNVTTKVTINVKLKCFTSWSQWHIQHNMKMTGLRNYSTSKCLQLRRQQYLWHLKQQFRFTVTGNMSSVAVSSLLAQTITWARQTAMLIQHQTHLHHNDSDCHGQGFATLCLTNANSNVVLTPREQDNKI